MLRLLMRYKHEDTESKQKKIPFNKLKSIPIITAIIALPSNAIAESYRETPSRQAWNNTCMSNALNNDGIDTKTGKQWGSSVDKAYAQSFCTCRHEQVKDKKQISFSEFTNAWQNCHQEFNSDITKSITKYLQIHLFSQ